MKILCQYDPSGPHYVRTGWAHAFLAARHDFRFWRRDTKSAFDAFSEFEPDIFIGTTYDIDRAMVKCITARPEMKVALFGSAWGPRIDGIDLTKYPIVAVNEQEKRTLEELKRTTGRPDFVFIHVTDKYLQPTMGGWNSIGIEPLGILNAADIVDYHVAPAIDSLKCDVFYVGGHWPYKSRNLNDFVLPLCHPSSGLNVKIFGNKQWPVHCYLGAISDATVKHGFASAVVCPNISESHSTDLGWDLVERPFKILSSGGFCISDYVDEAREIFTESELLMCRTAAEFREMVAHFVEHPADRIPYVRAGYKKVMESETYFHRVAKMFKDGFNLPAESTKCLEAYQIALNYLLDKSLIHGQ